VGLSTAAVYGALKVPEQPGTGEEIREALVAGNVEAAGRLLHNRLQAAAEELCPALASQLRCLARTNPAGYLLSGSGSSMFALCRGPGEARRVANEVRRDPDVLAGSQVFLVRSCS
jgi:4-diphosphocytidyl-2-C-methyl-D-erythritol kinase